MIHVPVKLDSLDDNTAVYRGTDIETVETQMGPFGPIEHTVTWPAVMIPRGVYEENGCPTVLMISLTAVEVPDS